MWNETPGRLVSLVYTVHFFNALAVIIYHLMHTFVPFIPFYNLQHVMLSCHWFEEFEYLYDSILVKGSPASFRKV